VRAQAVSRGGERVRAERGAGLVEALRSGPDRAEVRASGVLGRCEAGAGEGRVEEGVKRAGRKSLGRAGRTGPALRAGWSRPGGEGKSGPQERGGNLGRAGPAWVLGLGWFSIYLGFSLFYF